MTKVRQVWLLVMMASLRLAAGCGSGSDKVADDTGSESVTDSADLPDAGSVTDAGDASVFEGACLSSISGAVQKNGTEGMTGLVVVCIGLRCFTALSTEADGQFVWEYPRSEEKPCMRHDFQEERLHIEILAAANPERYASYAFVRVPTQTEISDMGADDYDLNVGNLTLFALPDESALYSPGTGVHADLSGVAFDVAPEALVKRVGDADEAIDHDQEISVLKAPLDAWTPLFAEVALDALFFISPRWAKISGEGVPLSIEAPVGWNEGDVGSLYLLGGYVSDYGDEAVHDRSAYIYKGADGLCINTDTTEGLTRVEDGVLTTCGTVTMQEGRLITSPIPRFTWIGIAK